MMNLSSSIVRTPSTGGEVMATISAPMTKVSVSTPGFFSKPTSSLCWSVLQRENKCWVFQQHCSSSFEVESQYAKRCPPSRTSKAMVSHVSWLVTFSSSSDVFVYVLDVGTVSRIKYISINLNPKLSYIYIYILAFIRAAGENGW